MGPCAKQFYVPCISCSKGYEKRTNNDYCRFANRMLRSLKDDKVARRLTVHTVRTVFDADDIAKSGVNDDEYVRCELMKKRKRMLLDAQKAAYIVQCTKSTFQKFVNRERNVIEQSNSFEEDAYFSHSFGIKQVCDVCNFSIFGAYLCCETCGLEICSHCYDELKRGEALCVWRYVRCRQGDRHIPSKFHLATVRLSFDELKELSQEIDKQFQRYAIKHGAECNGNHGRRPFQMEKCYCPNISDKNAIEIEPLCIIDDQSAVNSYARFKAHMTAHNPVLVLNVQDHPEYQSDLWTKDAFKTILSNVKCLRILDSSTFKVAKMADGKKITSEKFWEMFDAKHRPDEPYLKVKDFPESMRFHEIAPSQFENLFQFLPFLDYTRTVLTNDYDKGRLNILNFMSGFAGAPDPGPKAYLCCGLCDAPELSSTPLHLDVSNAVNFLPIVQAPIDMSYEEISEAVEKRLKKEKIDDAEIKRVMKKPDKAGAIWKIFHPNDNEKIRDAIREIQRKEGYRRESGDVIHNQNVIVTSEMVDAFRQKGIACRVFVQCEGEVVFVPSGAAHQVQNIHSCVKLAEDFVAPEGIEHIWRISEELRSYKCKDDLVQVDKMLYRAMRWCASILACEHPGRTTSSLVP